MSTDQTPRRVYERYLRGDATFEDVEAAAQQVMDRYAEALRSEPPASTKPARR